MAVLDQKEKRPAAGVRQADQSARADALTDIYYILAPSVDAKELAARFLLGRDGARPDIATGRTYALGAMYLHDLLATAEPYVHFSRTILVAILRSALRVRTATAKNIIDAMVGCGALVGSEVVQ